MHVAFHPEAEAELVAAAAWYSSRARGLGADFVDEVERATGRIAEHPESGTLFGEVRRVLVRRFPYSVLYTLAPDRAWVVAVMHQHRRPGYWRVRTL